MSTPPTTTPSSPARRSRRDTRGRCSGRSWASSPSRSAASALGAYIGRDLSGGWGILAFIGALRHASSASTSRPRAATSSSRSRFCSGSGLLLGLALGPILTTTSQADPVGGLAGRRRHGRVRRGPRSGRLRDPPRPVVVVPRPVLGAARADRVRARRDLRLDPGREHHLVRRRPRDLRRLHGPRLQPAAPRRPRRARCRSRRASSWTS